MGFAHYSERVKMALDEVLIREDRAKRSGNAEYPAFSV